MKYKLQAERKQALLAAHGKLATGARKGIRILQQHYLGGVWEI